MRTFNKLSTMAVVLMIAFSGQSFAHSHFLQLSDLSPEQITRLKQLAPQGKNRFEQNMVRDAKENSILTLDQKIRLKQLGSQNAAKASPFINYRDIDRLDDLTDEQLVTLKQLKSVGKDQYEVNLIREAKMAGVLTEDQRIQLRNMPVKSHTFRHDIVQKNSSR